jgi:hypothetical protein
MANPILPAKEYIQLLKELPEKAPEGIPFTEDEVDGILGHNAYALFCS